MKKRILKTLTNQLSEKFNRTYQSAKNILATALFIAAAGTADTKAQDKAWIKTTLDDSHIALDKQNQPWVYYYNKLRSYSSSGVMGPLVSFQGLHFLKIEFINNTDFYAAGTFTGTVTISGKTIISNGGRDIFIGRFNTNGEASWMSSYGSKFDEYMVHMFLREDGKINISGLYTATLKKGNDSLVAGTGMNLYFGECTSTGAISFHNKINGQGDEPWSVYNTGMCSDKAGNFYTAIRFNGPCTIDNQNYNGLYGTIVLKLNSSGQKIWEKILYADLTIAELEVDKDNNLVFCGSFRNTLEFQNISVTSKGFEDICLARLDHNGNAIWIKRAGGSSYFDNSSSMFITAENEIILSGGFRESADFDSLKLQSTGEADGFIAKYNKDGKAFSATSSGSSGMDIILEAASFGEEVYVIGYHQESMYWGSTPMTGEGVFVAKLAMALSAKTPHSEQPMIFPNPSEGHVFVKMPATTEMERIEILDLSGRIIQQEDKPGSEIEFELPSGIYFVRVSSKKGTSVQKIAIR